MTSGEGCSVRPQSEALLQVRLGTLSVIPTDGSVSVTTALGRDARATATVPADQIVGKAAEYGAETQINAWGEAAPVFQGNVVEAVVNDGAVALRLASGTILDEYVIDRLFVGAGMPPLEMIWSVARMAGITPDHIVLDGFDPPLDSFRVVMPVRGVTLDADVSYGHVRLTVDREVVRSILDFTNQPSYVEEFLDPGVWAAVRVEARTTYEAERAGVELIDGTLDRLAVEAQYSLAWAPGGTLTPFNRDALFAHPRAERFAIVRGISLPRAWLHAIADKVRSVPMARSRVALGGPPVGENPQFDEAIRAWQRAIQATDPVGIVSALWDSVEFYAGTVQVPELFTKPQCRALRRHLSPKALGDLALSETQAKRLADKIGQLNDPPLLAKLRHRLDIHDVPFTDDEFKALWRLRQHRNDFTHGRERGTPQENDLHLAKALVNRILVFWAHAIDATSE